MTDEAVRQTVIPFGRHAGRSLDAIAGGGDDRDGLLYLDWLTGESWFVRKGGLYRAVRAYLADPPIARALDLATGEG